MKKQLKLPFDALPPNIEERVRRQTQWFCALGFGPSLIISILSSPEKHWRIKQKRIKGKKVTLFIPSPELKRVQRRLVYYLDRQLFWTLPRRLATAFSRGDSIVVNAKLHRHNRSSLVFDLADAYQQIRTRQIYRLLLKALEPEITNDCRRWLESAPHEEETETPGVVWRQRKLELEARAEETLDDRAWLISRLVTFQGRLRKGPPSSPFIFNLMLDRLDREIAEIIGAPTWLFRSSGRGGEGGGLTRRFGVNTAGSTIVYTRYGDDLCFSSSADQFPVEIEQRAREMIRQEGLRLNHQKTKRSGNGILEFPGVAVVQGRIRPNTEYVRKVLGRRQTKQQKLGHRGHLGQFGRQGRLKCLRFLYD